MKKYLSKTEFFEASLTEESPVADLEKFSSLDSIISKSLEPAQQNIQQKAPTPSAPQNIRTPDFAVGTARWVPTAPPLTKTTPPSFSQTLRARAQARASFSRAGIIKSNKKSEPTS